MSADIKRESRSVVLQLVLTLAGALLMIAPPYAMEALNLTTRLQSMTLVGIELALLLVGFALLYLAFRQR